MIDVNTRMHSEWKLVTCSNGLLARRRPVPVLLVSGNVERQDDGTVCAAEHQRQDDQGFSFLFCFMVMASLGFITLHFSHISIETHSSSVVCSKRKESVTKPLYHNPILASDIRRYKQQITVEWLVGTAFQQTIGRYFKMARASIGRYKNFSLPIYHQSVNMYLYFKPSAGILPDPYIPKN